MAKSHERKIVDVRDLFGQAKEKIDLPEVVADTSDRPSQKGLFPGGGGGGWGSGALGEYKPKACTSSSGNDNVFFGGPPPGGSGSRRRQAPRPPVLIDVDVGIAEQDIEDDVSPPSPDPPRSAGPWSFGKPAAGGRSSGGGGGGVSGGGGGSRPQLGPPGGGMPRAAAGSSPGGSAAGSSPTVNTNNGPQSAAMNGRRATPGNRPVNKYEGRPLPAPPASTTTPTTKPTTAQPTGPPSVPPPPPPAPPLPTSAGGGGRTGKYVTGGPMSNFSLGAKKSPPPSQPNNQRLNGGEGGGSAKSQASLDQSSSGVETDDNGTPESTIESRAPRLPNQRPKDLDPKATALRLSVGPSGVNQVPPPPPPAPPSQGTDSSYHSDEGSDDEEDEQTLDFDEEEDDDPRRSVYQEYHGDDYGQFLKDDTAADAEGGGAGVAPRGRKKRQKRRKKKDAAQTPGSTASVSSSENATLKKRTLKGRLAAVFMGAANSGASADQQQQGAPKRALNPAPGTIHTFSFADSKIGTTFIQQPGKAADDPVYGSATGSGPADLAPCDAAYGGDRKWWSTDTLSARTMSTNSDVMLRRPSAHKHMAAPQPSLNANGLGPDLNGSGELIDGMDFESRRKSVIYGVHTDRRSQNKSIFRRFKKDEKEMVADMIDNTVTNPLVGLEAEANNTHF